jgi:hypothetical protein
MDVRGLVPNSTVFSPQRKPAPLQGPTAADRIAGSRSALPAGEAATAREAGATPPPQEASLWDILTDEERAFFSEQASMGPLSYKPGKTSEARGSAPTGQRIDVRG